MRCCLAFLRVYLQLENYVYALPQVSREEVNHAYRSTAYTAAHSIVKVVTHLGPDGNVLRRDKEIVQAVNSNQEQPRLTSATSDKNARKRLLR